MAATGVPADGGEAEGAGYGTVAGATFGGRVPKHASQAFVAVAHAAEAPLGQASKPRRRFRHAAADPHDYLRVIDGTGPIAHHGIREQ